MLLRAPTIVIASLTALGCGRPETAADRHVAELSEDLSKLEADRDAQLGGSELGSVDPKDPRVGKSAPPVAMRSARSVQLGEPATDASDDPNDATERPDIRIVGSRVRSTKGGGRGRADVTEAPPSRSSALDPEAKESYEAGLALVQGKQYGRGLEALRAFMVRWPDHPYAENATYWQGEAHFALGEYGRAVEQFEAVLARFGSGKKAPDALLKLGLCHERLGAPERAREYFQRLKAEYPKSEAAKKIPGASGRDPAKGTKENR